MAASIALNGLKVKYNDDNFGKGLNIICITIIT